MNASSESESEWESELESSLLSGRVRSIEFFGVEWRDDAEEGGFLESWAAGAVGAVGAIGAVGAVGAVEAMREFS